MDVCLASTSKYRAQQLKQLGVPFITRAPKFDEEEFKARNPFFGGPKEAAAWTLEIAKKKAQSLQGELPHYLIIGGDQVVFFESQVLGKPGNPEKAAAQLLKLQGKTHLLITALVVLYRDRCDSFVNTTELNMHSLSESEVQRYTLRDMPIDCAGSYKIEAGGIGLMKRIITDDFTAIQGLPLLSLSATLRKYGVQLYQ